MSRLTNSTSDIIDGKAKQIDMIKEQQIYLKLKTLEDLEDDLGCPLDVVLKALKEGSIEDENGGIQIVGITIGGDGELYLHAINGDLYLLKDHGKTWWLKGDRSE